MDNLTVVLFVVFAIVVVAALAVYLVRGGKFSGKIGPGGVEVNTEERAQPEPPRPNVTQTAKNEGVIKDSPIKVDAASGATATQEADTKGKIDNSGIEIK